MVKASARAYQSQRDGCVIAHVRHPEKVGHRRSQYVKQRDRQHWDVHVEPINRPEQRKERLGSGGELGGVGGDEDDLLLSTCGREDGEHVCGVERVEQRREAHLMHGQGRCGRRAREDDLVAPEGEADGDGGAR